MPYRESASGHESLAESDSVEIPSADWAAFLESFSRQHEGWLVNISVTSNSRKHVQGVDYRLAGVTPEQKNRELEIMISILRGGNSKLIRVKDPVRIKFTKDARGAHEGLDVISADCSITSLRFRVAADPATLDGIVTAEEK